MNSLFLASTLLLQFVENLQITVKMLMKLNCKGRVSDFDFIAAAGWGVMTGEHVLPFVEEFGSFDATPTAERSNTTLNESYDYFFCRCLRVWPCSAS